MNLTNLDSSFALEVKEKSGQLIELCFQCQKCSSGCPMGESADYHPNQIIRFIQFGMAEKVLSSTAIWFCLGCETCSVRCPNDISIAAVMDAVREIALARNISPGEKKSPLFHRIFLNNVKRSGRLHEVFMMVDYKLKSKDLFSDMDTGIKMFRDGKLPLFSKGMKNKKVMKRIFEKVKNK